VKDTEDSIQGEVDSLNDGNRNKVKES